MSEIKFYLSKDPLPWPNRYGVWECNTCTGSVRPFTDLCRGFPISDPWTLDALDARVGCDED